jgi:hypothetical protein
MDESDMDYTEHSKENVAQMAFEVDAAAANGGLGGKRV